LQVYDNGSFYLMITLLTIYMPNFKAYLGKLGVAPPVWGYLDVVKE